MRLGIDLGGTKIEILVLGDQNEILLRKRTLTPKGDYEKTILAIVELVSDAGREFELGAIGVGVAIPGAESLATGLIKNANSTCLIGKSLKNDLSRALGRPVRLANDANCFVLSESVDGVAAGAPTVFGVILGTGVGGGLVVDQKIIAGKNSIAGEWGHNPLPWPSPAELKEGPKCYCGRRGCVETFLSGPALEAQYAALSGESQTAEQIAARAENGDHLANDVLTLYEDRLARGLASVINVFDPHVIVLGGGVSNISRIYQQVPKIWGKYVFSDQLSTRLERAAHGDSSGVRGAAWLF